MRKYHTVCLVAAALAIAFVVATRGSVGSVAALLPLLVCPIAMFVAMRLVMGTTTAAHSGRDHSDERA